MCGRDLDVVDQKDLALPARREVGEHGAGGEHVKAATDQSLEDFEAGVELAKLQIEALFVKTATVHACPDLAVDGNRMQIADTNLGFGLRNRGRGGGEGAE